MWAEYAIHDTICPIALQTGSSLGFGWVGEGAWHRLSEESGHSRADQSSHRGPGKACYKTLLVTVLAVGTHLLVLWQASYQGLECNGPDSLMHSSVTNFHVKLPDVDDPAMMRKKVMPSDDR